MYQGSSLHSPHAGFSPSCRDGAPCRRGGHQKSGHGWPVHAAARSARWGLHRSGGRIFHSESGRDCGGSALRMGPAGGGAQLLAGAGRGGGRRCRAVHGEQPDHYGLGVPKGQQQRAAAQLGDRLSGQLHRSRRDRSLGSRRESLDGRRGRGGQDRPGYRHLQACDCPAAGRRIGDAV